MSEQTPKVKAQATQEFVPLKEVRDGIVILKDGSLRALLMASSINLALKSGDEQQAIIGQFQNFLNSLEFPVQFFVESRDLDIRPYVALLEERYTAELDDLIIARADGTPTYNFCVCVDDWDMGITHVSIRRLDIVEVG